MPDIVHCHIDLDALLSAMRISFAAQGVSISCVGSPRGCAGDTRSMHTRLHSQIILRRMVDLPMGTLPCLINRQAIFLG